MSIYNVTEQMKPTSPLVPLNLSKVLFIIPHHVGAVNYTWQRCNVDHKAKGWNCAGYNELIYTNGDVYILRGDHIGAQCANVNSKSYGIAVVGDYEKQTEMPEAQFKSLVARIKFNKSRFPNFVKVAPHKELYPTDCPGKHFPMDRVISAVNDVEDPVEDAVKFLSSKAGINEDIWLKNAKKIPWLDQCFIMIANAWKGGK